MREGPRGSTLAGVVLREGATPLDPRTVAICVLGRFTVAVDGEVRSLRPTAGRVLRRLVAARGSSVPEDVLLESFWPGFEPRAARNNLHVTIHHARRVVGAGRIGRGDGTYRLVLGPEDRIDAELFAAAADRLLHTTRGPGADEALGVLSLWGGEPLPEDRYSDWSRPYRELLIALRRDLGLACAARLRDGGREAQAIAVLRALRADAPLDERVAHDLMVALAGAGQRHAALSTFEDLSAGLRSAWSVDVSVATRRLATLISAGVDVEQRVSDAGVLTPRLVAS